MINLHGIASGRLYERLFCAYGRDPASPLTTFSYKFIYDDLIYKYLYIKI